MPGSQPQPEQDASTEGGFNGYLLTRLRSENPTTRRAAVETLHDLLFENDSEGDSDRNARTSALLHDAALELIPALLGVHSDNEEKVEGILLLIADTSSPRETLFALEEGLKGLLDDAEQFEEVSDNDSEEAEQVKGISTGGLLERLQIIVKCLTKVIPRLPLKKSTPTILTISDIIEEPLIILAPQATPSRAADLLEALTGLVNLMWDWSQTKADTGGEQRSLCLGILQIAISMCGSRLDGRLLNRWFLAMYPRYGKANTMREMELADAALDAASKTFHDLGYTLDDLSMALRQVKPQGPHAPIAALLLLAHTLVSVSSTPETLDEAFLDAIRPILVLAICDPTGGGLQDAGLTVAWALIYRQTSIEIDFVENLVEILMPVTASNRDPIARLACFKLLGEVILKCGTDEGKIGCLKLILEDANPYDQLRAESLVIFRDVVLASPIPKQGTFFVTALKQIPELHRLPARLAELSPDEILESREFLFLTNLLSTIRVLCESTIRGNEDLVRRLHLLDLPTTLIKPAQVLAMSFAESKDSGEAAGEGDPKGGDMQALFARERLEDEVTQLSTSLSSLQT